MSLFDVTLEVVIRVNDPTNGVKLYEDVPKIAEDLNNKIMEEHPNCIVLPRGFRIVE